MKADETYSTAVLSLAWSLSRAPSLLSSLVNQTDRLKATEILTPSPV